MTNCTGAPAERLLESYLQGTLPAHQAEEFEEHYFDCPVCLAQLQALQAVSTQLGRNPVEIPRQVYKPSRPLWSFAAIAAALLIVILGYRAFMPKPQQPSVASAPPAGSVPASPPSQPAPISLSQLADLTLPVFRASTLRGAVEESLFQTGMKDYAGGNCKEAIEKLKSVPPQDEEAIAAKFYLGACQMHMGNLPAAAKSLRSVAEAGDSPQQEAAWYYLAQTELAGNDAATARASLQHVVALHRDFERRASKELAQISDKSPAR
jgi:TolA-binding protein